jgi:hypothetical protein
MRGAVSAAMIHFWHENKGDQQRPTRKMTSAANVKPLYRCTTESRTGSAIPPRDTTAGPCQIPFPAFFGISTISNCSSFREKDS